MTAPTKIHLQALDKPDGVTVCGRKAAPGRVTTNPDAASCDVCIVTHLRQSDTPSRGRKTVLDRLAESPRAGVDLAGDDPARDRAFSALAALHLDEFLELYRAELEKTARRR